MSFQPPQMMGMQIRMWLFGMKHVTWKMMICFNSESVPDSSSFWGEPSLSNELQFRSPLVTFSGLVN